MRDVCFHTDSVLHPSPSHHSGPRLKTKKTAHKKNLTPCESRAVSGAQPRLRPSSGSVAGSQPILAVLHSLAARASPSPALLETEKHKQDADNRSCVWVTADLRAAEHGAVPGTAPNYLVSTGPCQEVLGKGVQRLPLAQVAAFRGGLSAPRSLC